MAITTLDQYVGSSKQDIRLCKTGGRTTVAAGWFSLFDVAGDPGSGTLAGSSTANGVIPTDATAGCPTINAFGGGATGYISKVAYGNTVACRIALFDMLWKGGAYAFNANTAVTASSYSSRIPNSDYSSTEIWVEQVTAATGNQAVNVTYTNQSGTGSKTTGAVGIGAAPTVGRCWQLPFAAGDSGVQTVTNVAGTVASVGTFNVLVLRRLWEGRVKIINDGSLDDLIRTGMPQVYTDSALMILINTDSTAAGIPDLGIQVANG